MSGPAYAHVGAWWATELVEVADPVVRPEVLDRGWWAVVATFEGAITGYPFDRVVRAPLPPAAAGWPGVAGWESSLDRAGYLSGVDVIRSRIAAGDVYQVNLCRVLNAGLPAGADPLALAHLLADGNPAPYQGIVRTPDGWVVTASPELFLERSGDLVRSAPIKGTAAPGAVFAAKDFPENIMITDLVRNDLGRVARAGTVRVEELAAARAHPGLQHLESRVSARLLPAVGWGELLAATFPPGSVSGAPKHTALQVIRDLEPVPRGVYCGAFGFVDGDRRTARLAVTIRTFNGSGNRVSFGTGAGITYSSDPDAEWRETELKARTLLGLAARTDPAAASGRRVRAGSA